MVRSAQLDVRRLNAASDNTLWALQIPGIMSVKEIEATIAGLPAEELAELMTWLEEYHARTWDKQIEDDLETGRLDALLDEVDREYESGSSRPL